MRPHYLPDARFACAVALTWMIAMTAQPTEAMAMPDIVFDSGQGGILPSVGADLRRMPGSSEKAIATHPDLDALVLVGMAGGGLTVSAPFPGGFQPRFSAVADLDGNGRLDIVTTSPVTGRAYVIRQNADSSFTVGSALPIGINPFAPALVDLTGNGLPEIVAPIRGNSEVAILPNLGNGLFAAGTRVPTAASPEHVALADFDGDGVLDLAVVCAGANLIQVFFGVQGEGGITFPGQPVQLPTGSGPSGLIAIDLDGDGRPDLATASTGSSSVTIHYARPQRTFEAGSYLFAGTAPQSLVAADLNQSGYPDLIVANPGTQMLTILRNQGNDSFVRTTRPMPFRPARVALLDLNGDGLPDLIASSQTSHHVRALLNQTPVAICPGDVTGDRRVNLVDLNKVLTNFGSETSAGDANGDGVVNLADLNLVLTNFGSVCGET
ncbi:MAG: FG-GAP-like repeat-containing protein [Phycisphaerales bacterium]